jgi:3-hydroxyisobutyrate dehydrogenase
MNDIQIPAIESGTTKIGWIGTGVMGSSMCAHLMNQGFQATIYTRSPEKAQALIAQGATWVDSPKAVAENSDVTFAIVGFPADVREVFLSENGAIAGSTAGNIAFNYDRWR